MLWHYNHKGTNNTMRASQDNVQDEVHCVYKVYKYTFRNENNIKNPLRMCKDKSASEHNELHNGNNA